MRAEFEQFGNGAAPAGGRARSRREKAPGRESRGLSMQRMPRLAGLQTAARRGRAGASVASAGSSALAMASSTRSSQTKSSRSRAS